MNKEGALAVLAAHMKSLREMHTLTARERELAVAMAVDMLMIIVEKLVKENK